MRTDHLAVAVTIVNFSVMVYHLVLIRRIRRAIKDWK